LGTTILGNPDIYFFQICLFQKGAMARSLTPTWTDRASTAWCQCGALLHQQFNGKPVEWQMYCSCCSVQNACCLDSFGWQCCFCILIMHKVYQSVKKLKVVEVTCEVVLFTSKLFITLFFDGSILPGEKKNSILLWEGCHVPMR